MIISDPDHNLTIPDPGVKKSWMPDPNPRKIRRAIERMDLYIPVTFDAIEIK
jgi:hypothetical protein